MLRGIEITANDHNAGVEISEGPSGCGDPNNPPLPDTRHIHTMYAAKQGVQTTTFLGSLPYQNMHHRGT